MLLHILSVIAPVFICALIGFIWVKRGQDFDTDFVSTLVMNIGAPCLIFSTFMEIEIELQDFAAMAKASAISMLFFSLAGWIMLKLCKLDLRTFLPSQMQPNVGNMGLPLCLLAFGDEGLALGLTFFMVNTFVGFTLGMGIASGSLSLKALIKNPMFHSVLITLAAVLSGFTPPDWLQNTTSLLAGFTIPMMLIALGVSLGRFKITSLKRSVLLSAFRLGAGFILGTLTAELLGLEGTARGVLILQCSMPIAVFAYMFAVRYKRSPEEVAGTVVISTVMSFLSLPFLLWFVLPA